MKWVILAWSGLDWKKIVQMGFVSVCLIIILLGFFRGFIWVFNFIGISVVEGSTVLRNVGGVVISVVTILFVCYQLLVSLDDFRRKQGEETRKATRENALWLHDCFLSPKDKSIRNRVCAIWSKELAKPTLLTGDLDKPDSLFPPISMKDPEFVAKLAGEFPESPAAEKKTEERQDADGEDKIPTPVGGIFLTKDFTKEIEAALKSNEIFEGLDPGHNAKASLQDATEYVCDQYEMVGKLCGLGAVQVKELSVFFYTMIADTYYLCLPYILYRRKFGNKPHYAWRFELLAKRFPRLSTAKDRI